MLFCFNIIHGHVTWALFTRSSRVIFSRNIFLFVSDITPFWDEGGSLTQSTIKFELILKITNTLPRLEITKYY